MTVLDRFCQSFYYVGKLSIGSFLVRSRYNNPQTVILVFVIPSSREPLYQPCLTISISSVARSFWLELMKKTKLSDKLDLAQALIDTIVRLFRSSILLKSSEIIWLFAHFVGCCTAAALFFFILQECVLLHIVSSAVGRFWFRHSCIWALYIVCCTF